MPLYEYNCPAGHVFTDLQKMPGRAHMRCPTCGKRARKVISAVGLHFKGQGFHATDYGPYGPKKGKESDHGA